MRKKIIIKPMVFLHKSWDSLPSDIQNSFTRAGISKDSYNPEENYIYSSLEYQIEIDLLCEDIYESEKKVDDILKIMQGTGFEGFSRKGNILYCFCQEDLIGIILRFDNFLKDSSFVSFLPESFKVKPV